MIQLRTSLLDDFYYYIIAQINDYGASMTYAEKPAPETPLNVMPLPAPIKPGMVVRVKHPRKLFHGCEFPVTAIESRAGGEVVVCDISPTCDGVARMKMPYRFPARWCVEIVQESWDDAA